MRNLTVNYTRGQMQIQQMAFVLIAIMMFFALILVIYAAARASSLKSMANDLKSQEASELVRKLVDSPELGWTGDGCSHCVDLDKAFLLKNRAEYKGFWRMKYLKIEKIYPESTKVECNGANYPDCSTITLVNETANFGIPSSSFVSICRWDQQGDLGYTKCEIGKVYASPRDSA